MTTKRRDREVDNEPGPPSTSTGVDGNAEVVMTTNQWPIVLLRTMPPFTLLRAPLDRVGGGGGGGAPPPQARTPPHHFYPPSHIKHPSKPKAHTKQPPTPKPTCALSHINTPKPNCPRIEKEK